MAACIGPNHGREAMGVPSLSLSPSLVGLRKGFTHYWADRSIFTGWEIAEIRPIRNPDAWREKAIARLEDQGVGGH